LISNTEAHHMNKMNAVLVYCGASAGNNPLYAEETKRVGKVFVEENIQLIYGGGSIGLMGVLADSILDAGGKVTGVIPAFLNVKEVGHKGCTQLHEVNSMHERKALMEKLCDGVIVLPGGYGTLDEMFEMLTWSQLGLHQKPIGILNLNSFYEYLIAQLDVMVREGFLSIENRQLFVIDDSIEKLLAKMREFDATTKEQWLNRAGT